MANNKLERFPAHDLATEPMNIDGISRPGVDPLRIRMAIEAKLPLSAPHRDRCDLEEIKRTLARVAAMPGATVSDGEADRVWRLLRSDPSMPDWMRAALELTDRAGEWLVALVEEVERLRAQVAERPTSEEEARGE